MDKRAAKNEAQLLDAAVGALRGHGVEAEVEERQVQLGRSRADALIWLAMAAKRRSTLPI